MFWASLLPSPTSPLSPLGLSPRIAFCASTRLNPLPSAPLTNSEPRANIMHTLSLLTPSIPPATTQSQDSGLLTYLLAGHQRIPVFRMMVRKCVCWLAVKLTSGFWFKEKTWPGRLDW